MIDFRHQADIAQLVTVVGMISNSLTIANPNDGGMLDVVGFDTAVPEVIRPFASGDLQPRSERAEDRGSPFQSNPSIATCLLREALAPCPSPASGQGEVR